MAENLPTCCCHISSACLLTRGSWSLPQIYEVIREEEASFSRTLLKGIEKYKKAAAIAKPGAAAGYNGSCTF